MTCNHKWLTPEGNRTTCVQCGTDGFVYFDTDGGINSTCHNCHATAHYNVELEEEIKSLKKQIDDKIQEAFTARETGPWEKLREIRKIINANNGDKQGENK